MFDLFVLALIQLATLTGNPTTIGSTGWDHDYTGSTPTAIGSTGWDHDYTGSTPTNNIGSTGWDHDYTGSPTPPNPTIGSTAGTTTSPPKTRCFLNLLVLIFKPLVK